MILSWFSDASFIVVTLSFRVIRKIFGNFEVDITHRLYLMLYSFKICIHIQVTDSRGLYWYFFTPEQLSHYFVHIRTIYKLLVFIINSFNKFIISILCPNVVIHVLNLRCSDWISFKILQTMSSNFYYKAYNCEVLFRGL